MKLFRWISRTMGWKGVDQLTTRLSREEAIKIARTAIVGDPVGDQLSVTMVTHRGGTLIWTVSAPVIGRNVIVEVDDRTGQVIRIANEGVR